MKKGDNILVSQFGVPRTPEDFCERAVKCGHPRGMAIHLPEMVKKVLVDSLEMPPAELALWRCKQLTKWTFRASQLQGAELEHKRSMPEHMRVLLQQKRLLLFKEMLEEVGYPDTELIPDISRGFRLMGWQKKSGVFPNCVKRPQHSVETLKQLSRGLHRSIVGQLGGDDDDDPTVLQTWDKTLEEVSKGYIWRDQHSTLDQVFLAKRFGLVQKAGKLRVIDDCSIGGVNGALGVVEKYKVHAIDETAAFLTWMVTHAQERGLRESISGRTYDMKHAYKQFGISCEDRELVRLAVRDPVEHQVALFGVNSLPFGATGSVGGFLRISFAVWYIGMYIFRLPWTAYFDDYTVFSRDVLADNTAKTVDSLFGLLGIEIAKEGDKASGFSKRFKSLGVEVDLTEFSNGEVRIGHTQDRRDEIGAVLGDVLKAQSVTAKQAESLRGRMHWFESFAFGNGAVKILGDLSLRGAKNVRLGPKDIKALRFLKERVLMAPPLNLTPTCLLTWVVFTDGACEGHEDQKVGSIGGVLVDPYGRVTQFFGDEPPADLMELLLKRSKNPIYELEVMPVLVAILLWGRQFQGSQVCWYLDNEASRSAFLKAYGATEVADGLVAAFIEAEMASQIKSWFARSALFFKSR